MELKSIYVRSVLLATLALWGWQANAVVILKDLSTVDSIPGLTGFATEGDEMTGMSVQATFANGFTQTLSWATTGTDSGGVTGTGWSLTHTGDTYDISSWIFTNDTNSNLLGLVLDGRPGLTVFDTTFGGNIGTGGSADGRDFDTNLANDNFVVATYSIAVAIGANDPVGDIFHLLSVNFQPDGLRGNFFITQDTDNDSRFGQAPEPATLALLGLGLAGIGYQRRRKAL